MSGALRLKGEVGPTWDENVRYRYYQMIGAADYLIVMKTQINLFCKHLYFIQASNDWIIYSFCLFFNSRFIKMVYNLTIFYIISHEYFEKTSGCVFKLIQLWCLQKEQAIGLLVKKIKHCLQTPDMWMVRCYQCGEDGLPNA